MKIVSRSTKETTATSTRFVDAVKYQIAERRLTQDQAAKLLGYSQSQLSQQLGSYNEMTGRSMQRISEALGFPDAFYLVTSSEKSNILT